MSGDLGSFRLTDDGVVPAGAGLTRPHLALRQRALTTVIELRQKVVELESNLACNAIDERVWQNLRDLETITHVLRTQSLQPWELRQTFSLWQRNVNEVRGWLEYHFYVGAIPWSIATNPLQNGALFDGNGLDALRRQADANAEGLRLTKLIRHSRGAFVMNAADAYQYAAHDLPVWYLQTYSDTLASSLEAEQHAGLVRRAFYRKYGSDKCAYMHHVELRFFSTDRGPSKCLALSRSRQAYAQADQDKTNVPSRGANPGPASSSTAAPTGHALASQPAVLSGLQPREPASLPVQPPVSQLASTSGSAPLAPRLRVPASLPAKPHTPECASLEAPQPGSLAPASVGTSKAHGKKGMDDSDTSIGRPRKSRRTVQKLIRAEGLSIKASEVQVNTSAPTLFVTEARPVWFPSVFSPGESSLLLVDTSRSRQIHLSALQQLAVPKAVLEKSRLSKVPLVSYFVNVWHGTRTEGYGQKRGKRGEIMEGRSQAFKSPEMVISKMFLVWAKFRPFYLRKLAMSPAEDIPGLTPSDWRNALKLVVPLANTPRVMSDIGLDATFAVPEPEVVSAADEADEEAADESSHSCIDAPVPVSAIGPTDPPTHVSAPPESITTLRWTALCEPSSPPPPMPIPKTIGEVFDRLPHPSHEDYLLPPFVFTEDEDGGWPSVPWRRFWLWELREIEFRHELLSLDLTLRQAHPDLDKLQAIAPEQRFYSCKLCWGGSDFTPGCDDWAENALSHPDPRKRLRGLVHFVSFMSVWPRVDELLGPWKNSLAGVDSWDAIDTALGRVNLWPAYLLGIPMVAMNLDAEETYREYIDALQNTVDIVLEHRALREYAAVHALQARIDE
ncbi:hypothetical protein AURDEDRAFT_174965 [Auricularia subglabra TFB-10046 SS5]|uniref:Uncharacterized protein n=1 Tax=Auricularia subglabra (strain TFB-10046 / SS5) TaxID=717982 RepID=J0CXZ1_AURST|nr:hypothetical protein AURDEDRAFT_174965 [Auricularia subglabra TFB-10046 SS5]